MTSITFYQFFQIPKYLDDSDDEQQQQTVTNIQMQQIQPNQPIQLSTQTQIKPINQTQTQIDFSRQKLNQQLMIPIQFVPSDNNLYQKIISSIIMTTSFYQGLCCILWLFSRDEIIYSEFWYTIILLLISIFVGISQIQAEIIQNYLDIYFRCLRRKIVSCIFQLIIVVLFSYEFTNTLGKVSSIMMLTSIALTVLSIILILVRK